MQRPPRSSPLAGERERDMPKLNEMKRVFSFPSKPSATSINGPYPAESHSVARAKFPLLLMPSPAAQGENRLKKEIIAK